jgi:hypothetical protein
MWACGRRWCVVVRNAGSIVAALSFNKGRANFRSQLQMTMPLHPSIPSISTGNRGFSRLLQIRSDAYPKHSQRHPNRLVIAPAGRPRAG